MFGNARGNTRVEADDEDDGFVDCALDDEEEEIVDEDRNDDDGSVD